MSNPMDICGITKEDIELIQKTWQPVYATKESSGVLLFKVLFEMYPDYEIYFDKFKRPEFTSIFQNPTFQKHIKQFVMEKLNDIVNNLENKSELENILQEVAINHRRRNVKKIAFENIGKVVLETLRRGLESNYTAEVERAWTKVITCAMNYIGSITG